MQPEQAKFLLNFFLPQLKSEQATTTRILRAIPRDKAAYAPHPKCWSALRLAIHIAATEIWFLDAVLDLNFRDDDVPSPEWTTPANVARWYDANFAQRLPRLEALSPQHLATPVNFIGLRNEPAVSYLGFAIRHSVHHRGYLAAYLRPMGAEIPAIYVESADEPSPPSPAAIPVI
ncbi:MAG TPA: DinB family protein [Candidatus Acidoferrum sp.]|nr:DinB family protein [Candidatus Acidoferrum sp.]